MRPECGLTIALIAAGAAGLTTAAAAAEAAKTRYDIAAQPLDRALLRLAAKSGRQILFAPQSVAGKTSRALHGTMSLETALARMLPDGSLVGEFSGPIVLVMPAPEQARQSTEHVATPLAPNVTERAEAPVGIAARFIPLAELVVSALKRDTLLQRTAMSISVAQAGMADRDDTSISEISRRSPAMHVVTNSGTLQRLSIRGVRSAGEATTRVYYDETPVTGPAGATSDAGSTQPDLNLFDSERIETLRGPQGTLYGAGSLGGTVRVIFRKPDPTAASGRAELRGSVIDGGTPGASARLMLNKPLIEDVLAVRLAAYADQSGGYIDNVRLGLSNINGVRSVGGRLSLLFKPDPKFSLLLAAVHQNSRAEDSAGYWTRSLGPYRTDAPIRGTNQSDFDMISATANWEIEWGTLLGTASRYGWKTLNVNDYTSILQRAAADPIACQAYFSLQGDCDPIQRNTFDAYANSRLPAAWRQLATLHGDSREIRFTSRPGRPVTWTAGYFYEHARDHFDSFVDRAERSTGKVIVTPGDSTGYRYIDTRLKQAALFGEAEYRLLEGLSFTAGARRYNYKKVVTGEIVVPNLITLSEVAPLADLTPFREAVVEAQGWVSKLAVSYDVSPRAMVYASRTEGFRPGGVNNIPGAGPGAAVPRTYTPDSLISYEAGAKFSAPHGQFDLAMAGYVIDWDQIQVSTTSKSAAWTYNINAGNAHIVGAELEARARPVTNLQLSATASYSDARIADDRSGADADAGSAIGMPGDRLPFVPRWAGSLSGVYRFKAFGDVDGALRLDYSYTGQSASDFRPTRPNYEKQPAYALTDVQLGFEHRGSEVTARVTNVFNAIAPTLVSSINSPGQIFSARPRALTVTYRRNF